MSWEATAPYYRLLDEETARRRGGLHSAKVLLRSVDFAPVEACQSAGGRLEHLPEVAYGADPVAPSCWSWSPTPCTGWPRRFRRRSGSGSSSSGT